MTVKNPYQPPTYGMRSLAIERRIAAEQEADKAEQEAAKKPAKKKGKK